MKKALLIFLSLSSIFSSAQRINYYQYVLISDHYSFQNKPHEYELNKLLKCQLEEYGFKVFYDKDPAVHNPVDPCLFLKANIVNKSNIFLFKLLVEFTDCNNAVVLQTEVGGSKEPDRYDAFNEALDGALKSIMLSKYEFEGVPMEIILKDDQDASDRVALAKLAVDKSYQESKNNPIAANTSGQANVQSKQKPKANLKQVYNKKKLVAVNTTAVKIKPEPISSVSTTPEKISPKDKVADEIAPKIEEIKEKKIGEMLLYAQAIEDGYQLVDTTPKIILKLTKTIQPNYFNANVDDKYGVVFMKKNEWVFEYYTNGNLVSEKLNLRFPN